MAWGDQQKADAAELMHRQLVRAYEVAERYLPGMPARYDALVARAEILRRARRYHVRRRKAG